MSAAFRLHQRIDSPDAEMCPSGLRPGVPTFCSLCEPFTIMKVKAVWGSFCCMFRWTLTVTGVFEVSEGGERSRSLPNVCDGLCFWSLVNCSWSKRYFFFFFKCTHCFFSHLFWCRVVGEEAVYCRSWLYLMEPLLTTSLGLFILKYLLFQEKGTKCSSFEASCHKEIFKILLALKKEIKSPQIYM